MSLNDRRLLIELSAVLAIKLIIMVLLKVYFFSPADHQYRLEVGTAAEPAATDTHRQTRADKER